MSFTSGKTSEHRPGRGAAAAAAVVALILATGSGLAWARQDVGGAVAPPLPTERAYPHCLLERLDDQLVRCDDLTGNGAPAPAVVPEVP